MAVIQPSRGTLASSLWSAPGATSTYSFAIGNVCIWPTAKAPSTANMTRLLLAAWAANRLSPLGRIHRKAAIRTDIFSSKRAVSLNHEQLRICRLGINLGGDRCLIVCWSFFE